MPEARTEVQVGDRTLSLSNLDKVLWPQTGTTKGEAIDYYARVAPTLVPHLTGRPLTRVRFPDGVDGERFYEKRAPKGTPDWVRTAPVGMDKAGIIDFVVCDDTPTLVWMAQMGALELHPSLSKAATMECPSVLAFDLDPGPPAAIRECCLVALRVRELFGNFGMECFAKTSGSKGVQVYVPLNGEETYETVKPFAQAVAQALEKAEPALVVSRMTKSLRIGKVLVDWSQNTRSKTTVAVYSLRARDRPTVSTPVSWEEVEAGASGEDELVFQPADVLARIEVRGDLFAPVLELEQALPGGA
ncbi:MAG: non-homologous end-joining DNA ligase [Actinomycetota bacterium]|nr:non-homologous end-joining DNA ligase [Actinomycetota bacterium]